MPTPPEIPRPLTWLFAALVFSLAFQEPYIRIYGFPIQLTEALFLLTAACTAWLVGARRMRLKFDRLFIVLAFYFTALAMSAAFSERPMASAVKLVGEAYLIGLGALSFLVAQHFPNLKLYLRAWLAGSTFAAAIAVITVILFYVDRDSGWHAYFLHHYGSLPPGNYPRVDGTFIYPAMLCNFFTVSTVLLLVSQKSGWIEKKWFIASLTLHIMAVIFTFTPGIGGVLLALGLWFSFTLRGKKSKLPSASFAALGIASAFAFLVVSALSFRPIATSPYHFEVWGFRIDPTQRFLTWQGAAETFLNFPILGRGLGLGVASVKFLAPSGQHQLLTDAHNVFLNVGGQAGLIGIATLLALIMFLMSRLRAAISTGIPSKIFAQALMIAFVSAFLFQGLVGSFENARHLWVLFGMIAALPYLSDFDKND